MLVLGAVVLVDTLFYAAIAPLLPSLAHELRLSKLSAGLLTAAYPIGTLVAALPGGLLTVRIGAKRTVYIGLTLLAGSTLAFGWVNNAAGLDAARLIEGVGGACSWAGAMAWLVADVPADRRGGAIGGALGAAIAGSLFGPVIGTVASAVGRGPAFSGVVVLALILVDQARRIELTHVPSGQRLRDLGAALRDRAVGSAMWLVALPALASGALSVLAPLRLHRLGADATAIGGTFLTAAAIEALLTPAVGALSDRRGRLLPLRAGLAGAAVAVACFTVPGSWVLLAVVVVAIAALLAAFWAPAMAMLSETSEAAGLEHGLGAALMNLAWASGQTAGAVAGGAMAKAAGDALPMGAVAGVALLTLLVLGLRPPRVGVAPAVPTLPRTAPPNL